MVETSPAMATVMVHREDSNSPRQNGQQHPLSCTHCRQRKVKCNKIHPCTPCQRSSLDCIFPERARHTKKKKSGSKATNEELMARLNRMEQLIGKMEGEGKTVKEEAIHSSGPPAASPTKLTRSNPHDGGIHPNDGSGSPSDGLNRYIGGNFWRSLTSEASAVDDASDGDENSPFSSHSNSDSYNPRSLNIFGSAIGSSRTLRPLHPPPSHILTLCELYVSNVDPVFKILHAPSLRILVSKLASNLDSIPTDNYFEPLLFAMYYAAITTLANEQCLQLFQQEREFLLGRYRAGTERALANADFLNTTEMGTLQALSIFLITVRANDDSQYTWTLTAVAVRLAHALGLHREGTSVNMSPFAVEMRRRLWWELIALDVRCCEDRASDPLILESSFNTRRPLNINDSDISPEMTEPPVERIGFTEMAKGNVSNEVSFLKWQFGYMPPIKDGDPVNPPPPPSFQEQMAMLAEIEKTLHDKILVHCDPKIPIAWVVSVIARLIMFRIRLVIYHPIEFPDRPGSRPNVSGEQLLETAVQVLEYTHLLDTEPAAARWRWFFKTYVQWYTLATTLAELCVQSRGPLVERAWRIVDVVFEIWSARVADSRNGMLWRPMKKLMSKAQAKRQQTEMMSQAVALQQQQRQQQQPLPQFDALSFAKPDPSLLSPSATYPTAMENHGHTGLQSTFPVDTQSPSEVLAPTSDGPSGAINWAEWDAFMHDFETGEPSTYTDTASMHMGSSTMGSWW
ncbi:MAG: hypothetical protein Q9163_006321 [Psora crenata]